MISALLNTTLLTIGGASITPWTLIGTGLTIVCVGFINAMVERTLGHLAARDDPRWPRGTILAISRLLRYAIWAVGMLVGLKMVGVDLTGVAVVGGAVGVGLGLGMQTLFANFASGVVLLLEGSLKVGDYIDLQSGVAGRVVDFGMRYTRVNTNDNIDIIVPNTELMNGRVVNWTFDSGTRRLHVPFSVAYGTDKQRAREAGIAAAQKLPGVLLDAERAPEVVLVRLGESAMEFELLAWCSRELTIRPSSTHAALLWLVHDELVARQIAIPYPTRDVNLRLVGGA